MSPYLAFFLLVFACNLLCCFAFTIPAVPLIESNYTYCAAKFLSAHNYPAVGSSASLQAVALITRHGARSPVNLFPQESEEWNRCSNSTPLYSYLITASGIPSRIIGKSVSTTDENAYQDESFWKGNCFSGQLTDLGMQQALDIGDGLRQIYGTQGMKFLPPTIQSNPDFLYVRSSDAFRTQQTAQLLLSNLFPNDTYSIVMHTYPDEIENLYSNGNSCPNYNDYSAEVLNSDLWINFMKNQSALITRLASITGTSNLPDWLSSPDHLFDNLHSRYCHSIPLPCSQNSPTNCVTNDDVNDIGIAGDQQYQIQYSEVDYTKGSILTIGAWLLEIRGYLLSASQTSGNPRLRYWSGHDTSIAPLLGALGFTQFHWPAFASNLIFELWQNNDQSQFIRFFYNGELHTLPFCSNVQCNVQEFFAYFQQLLPDNQQALRNVCGVTRNRIRQKY